MFRPPPMPPMPTLEQARASFRERLRDEFAMTWLSTYRIAPGPQTPPTIEQIAEACYRIADAMLAEREKANG